MLRSFHNLVTPAMVLILASACSNADVRPAAVAGAFYPGDSKELARAVDGYLEKAETSNETGRLVALVAPHAGYVYCGDTMAASFKQIEGGDYDLVVLLGCPHRIPVRIASVYTGEAYETPLGRVPIDGEVVAALLENEDLFQFEPSAHKSEHSLEVELPFLQRTLGEFSIVPILVGTHDQDKVQAIGKAVADAVREREVLLVCSTDMSHYPKYMDAIKIDTTALAFLAEFNLPTFCSGMEQLERYGISNLSCVFCGKMALAATIQAARELGADRARIFRYRNSGDVSRGDKDRVVGYGAAGFYETKGELPPVMRPEKPLTEEQREILLKIARESLEANVRGEKYEPPEIADPVLNEHRGAFVTLTRHGELRGCIGQFRAKEPLYKVVATRARAAALEDPRFPKVRAEELPELHVEVSALTPMMPVKDFEEVVVGRDGLYVTKGFNRGTLLPQVAWERGWSTEVFLGETCRKAGLPRDAWKAGAKFERYGADVFGESEPEEEGSGE